MLFLCSGIRISQSVSYIAARQLKVVVEFFPPPTPILFFWSLHSNILIAGYVRFYYGAPALGTSVFGIAAE